MMDSYLNIVLPLICNTGNQEIIMMVKTVIWFSKKCPSLVQYLSLIVKTLYSILESLSKSYI